jgi:hypothetical protein
MLGASLCSILHLCAPSASCPDAGFVVLMSCGVAANHAHVAGCGYSYGYLDATLDKQTDIYGSNS